MTVPRLKLIAAPGGGDGGNRTPVQKAQPMIYYKRSPRIFESLTGSPRTESRFASPIVFCPVYQTVHEAASRFMTPGSILPEKERADVAGAS